MKLGVIAASMLIGAASLACAAAYAQTAQTGEAAKAVTSERSARSESALSVVTEKTAIQQKLVAPQDADPPVGALPQRRGVTRSAVGAPMTSPPEPVGSEIPPVIPPN